MTHPQIERDDIIDRYVRRELAPDEQRAFEEHFFGCDECFANVQELERFRAGLRSEAQQGGLSGLEPSAETRTSVGWLRWALVASAAAAVFLAAVTGWLYFGKIRELRQELGQTSAALGAERTARARAEATSPPSEAAESAVAFVMLSASRAVEKPERTLLSTGTKRLLIWIDTPASKFDEFRLQVLAPDQRVVLTLDHLRRNGYGALLASVPADQLPAGDLRITLTGEAPPPATLVGDYRLTIEKR